MVARHQLHCTDELQMSETAVHIRLWWPDTAQMIVISPTKLSGAETMWNYITIMSVLYLTLESLSRVIDFV